MPLLVITGLPSSGKSTIAQRIAQEFKRRGVDVEHVKDEPNNGFSIHSYGDFRKANHNFHRSVLLKSVLFTGENGPWHIEIFCPAIAEQTTARDMRFSELHKRFVTTICRQ